MKLARWVVVGLVLTWLMMTTYRLSDEGFGTLHGWLTCDDCAAGERAAVSAMRWKAVARLDAALAGPSQGRDSVMKLKIGQSYDGAGIQSRVPGLSREAYVASRRANYVATYQKRAALSLADIGGWRARRALERAIADSAKRQYRPDVLRAIQFALATLEGDVFTGRVEPYRLSFADPVTVVAPPGESFDGDERVTIDGGIFPVEQVRQGDTIQIPAIADLGPHILSVSNVGTSGDTQNVGVLVTSLVDMNDRAMLSCPAGDTECVVMNAPTIVVSATTPFTSFVTLGRSPVLADTLDYFKIQNVTPGENLPLTAHLEWHGPANLDLLWRQCSPFVPVGNASGATAASEERTIVSIPPGQCWVLQVIMGAGPPGPALARLRVTTP